MSVPKEILKQQQQQHQVGGDSLKEI